MTQTPGSEGRDVGDTPSVAVTGAGGYIGSRVLQIFQRDHPEWELTAIDNGYRSQVQSVGDVEIEHVDIRNRSRLEDALVGADVVVHLAAVSGVDDCDDNADLAYEVNVTGTSNVAWFCRKTGAAMAFPFSMAVLGDPQEFPITADLPRDPMNWYGRTKAISEGDIESFADGAFPAHMFMKSNLYGEHVVEDTVVSKPTVINFFVNRALAGETLTVYEPGTQSRNFVHVKDVARVYLHSTEALLERLAAGETGAETFEVASDEDPSVMAVAEQVQSIAAEETESEPPVELVENPRSAETMVENFAVDTSRIREQLGWKPEFDVESSIRELLAREEHS
ncbi:NAD-dependent epimerase/dehydratase family protein [Salinarchaeum laminariae]|uniref:NAD-dependent epimerase/dehydratase family protein n=1 Tax=Salinarchaeum laminariae TaxID=869888 RepID=UPI0020C001B1|nr:NAD(P)-dependent oxidoreductase [Salinarchaeum laminariae]